MKRFFQGQDNKPALFDVLFCTIVLPIIATTLFSQLSVAYSSSLQGSGMATIILAVVALICVFGSISGLEKSNHFPRLTVLLFMFAGFVYGMAFIYILRFSLNDIIIDGTVHVSILAFMTFAGILLGIVHSTTTPKPYKTK